MEKEKKSQSASETDFLLQWGTKKRLRCVKAKKDQNFASQSKPSDHSLPKKKLPSRFVNAEKESPSHATKNSEMSMNNRKALALSPEKEEKRVVWPRLYIALSSKEKEEDFMAMKGCKPPQRPKKRAKLIQRTLLLVSPGAWLTDLCQERYEVREKKSKKRPTGLKAMGSMESDSE